MPNTYEVLWCVLTINFLSSLLQSKRSVIPSCHSRVLHMLYPLIPSFLLLPCLLLFVPPVSTLCVSSSGISPLTHGFSQADWVMSFHGILPLPSSSCISQYIVIACFLAPGDLAKNNLPKIILVNWTVCLKWIFENQYF